MFTPAALLFDLDGTLLDTAADLAAALNYCRQQRQLPPLPLAQIRPYCSDGAKGLLACGFAIDEHHPEFTEFRQLLLDYYHTHVAEYTTLFPGMAEVLQQCVRQKIPWGIVTNKPALFTESLLRKMGLYSAAACVISGDTLPQRKPHPAPLLQAAAQLQRMPARCCYVGDAQRDIEAARRAGMFSIAALYGYRHAADNPADWQADAVIHTPGELETILFLS